MKRNLLLLAILMMAMPIVASAGITGILSGKVVDEKGKPLGGASVRVLGTSRQAPVKINGSFTISNITAGSYEILVKYVNYKDYKTTVRISADQTTEITVKMVESVVQANTTIVTAKREEKLVEKTNIGSIRSSSGEENTKIARETVQQAVVLKAGVQAVGAGFEIRGSRASETQIRVDGLDMGDQFTGGFGNAGFNLTPTVSSFAVEEVQVLTGGFSAEYGNALGGVVNTVVKTGRTDSYEGFARWRTDAPTLFGKAGNGIQLMGKNENTYEVGVGGPIPALEYSSFYLTGKYAYQKYGSNGLGVTDPWGNNLGQLENTQTWVKNITGRLKFQMGSIALNIGGQLGLSQRERGSWGWLYANDYSVTNIKKDANGILSGDTNFVREGIAKPAVVNANVSNIFASINHQLGDFTSYEFKVSMNINNSDVSKRSTFTNPSLLGGFDVYYPEDNLTSEFDPSNPFKLLAGHDRAIDVFQSATKTLPTVDGYSTGDYLQRNQITGYVEGPADATGTQNPYGLSNYFNQHGNDRNFDFRRSTFLQFDGNFNTIINANDSTSVKHNIKAGFELRTFTLKHHQNSLPWDGNAFYDVYTDEFGGNPYADNAIAKQITEQPKKPLSGAVYVQDQMSYQGIIINPGLRFDFTDPNSTYRLVNVPFTPITSDTGFGKTTMKYQVSPRITVAYPVTDRSIVNISYGIYFQMPVLSQLYDAYNIDKLRAGSILGNPQLKAQRTNQYQIAYNLQLNDDFAFDVTAYYKDNYNQTGIVHVYATPDAYDLYSVSEYGNSRGIEFTFKKRPTNNIGLNFNYTLSSTTATSSATEDNYNRQPDPYTGKAAFPLSEYPYSNDRRHQLTGIVDFVWSRDEGPGIGGIKPLENVNLNFTTRFQTGTPYTRLSPKGVPISDFNAERQQSSWQTDMRFSKAFPLKDWFGEGFSKSTLEFFVDVLNLFNRTEATSVYARSGDPDQDNSGLNRSLGDFSATVWYKTATQINASTYKSDQYDRFGNRFYTPQADFNGDGQITQLEKYQSYLKYVSTVQSRRAANYQAPRQVFFGFMIRF